MDKKAMSERDICTKFITPAIAQAGWDIQKQVREEFSFTKGRIMVRGKLHTRGKARRADFILYHQLNLPLAVIEGSVGESMVIPQGMVCCLGQRVMLFRPCLVFPDYLRLALSEPGALARSLALHKGIGAKHVNVADMRNALIPLPPLPEQHRILAKVDELMALCDQLKAQLAEARQQHAQLATVLVEQAVA